MFCEIEKNKLTLIDFEQLLDNYIEPAFINDCDVHGLIENNNINFNQPDVKKLFIHHVVLNLCDKVVTTKGDIVFCLPYELKDNLELVSYTKKVILFKNIKLTCNKISSVLPLVFIQPPELFNDFCEGIHNKRGEVIDYLNKAQNIINKSKLKSYSFDKIKKFATKYDLYFLGKDYFNRLKVKSSFAIR